MKKFFDTAFDAFCFLSLIGIWPRFIEPKTLVVEKLDLAIKDLDPRLEGLRIFHLSDLHFSLDTSKRLLKKILKAHREFQADLLLFSGDLFCYAQLEDPKGVLKSFLSKLKAPLGSFFSLGNHDYQSYVSLADTGYIDEISDDQYFLFRLAKRFFAKKKPFLGVHPNVAKIEKNAELCALLQETGHKLLHNETEQVYKDGAGLNITGLGDLWLDRFHPKEAFAKHQSALPSLVLSHNPDTFEELKNWPGDIIFSGHTHGGQVNLPFVTKRLIFQEKMKYLKGFCEGRLYVSRGLGSTKPFRLFCPPEVLCLRLLREA